MHAHAAHRGTAGWSVGELLILGALLAVTLAYLVLASRRRREPRGWNRWRTGSFLAGAALLTVAVVPGALPYSSSDFRGHMQQHLIVGMVAPLFLVLAAPLTLLLRSVPVRHGRQLVRVLRSAPARVIGNSGMALTLNLGGLVALYFTPLYRTMMENEAVHGLVYAHFLVAGYLFAWVIAGPDPAPHRPSVPARLVMLGVAIAGHAVVSQLLYAGIYVQVPVTAAERRGAGEIMYYGGDLAELALALVLVTTWRPRRRLAGAAPSHPGTPGRRVPTPTNDPAGTR